MSSGVPALDAMLSDGYWRGASTLVAGPSGSRKDTAGTALRLRRRATRGNRPHRDVPGKSGPTRADPARLLLVAQRPQRRTHVPHAGRPVSRRMGLRLLRHPRTHRREKGRHRQPRRPQGGVRGRTPVPRVRLLVAATVRSRKHQRDDDPGSLRSVRRHPPFGIRHLASVRQRRYCCSSCAENPNSSERSPCSRPAAAPTTSNFASATSARTG